MLSYWAKTDKEWKKKHFQRVAVVWLVEDGWTGYKLFKGNLAPIRWLTHHDHGL